MSKTTHASEFSADSFWDKLAKYAKTAGKEVVEKALYLYYVAESPDTPLAVKTAIYSALVYFVLPLDAVPDAIPIVGYTDDLGALSAVFIAVAMHITPEIKKKVAEKLKEWFDDDDDEAATPKADKP